MSSVTESTNQLNGHAAKTRSLTASRLHHVRGLSDMRGASPAAVETIIEARNIKKDYRKGKVAVPVLKGVNLAVNKGEFCAIVGKSGSGKSTLLHVMGTLDVPCQGEYYFYGGPVENVSARRRR